MKVLIIYDSLFGNTEKIARAMGNALGSQKDIEVLRVSQVKPEQLTGLELLIVGSPTQGGRPTRAIQDFLEKVPESAVKGTNVAAFDTRLPARWVGIFGYEKKWRDAHCVTRRFFRKRKRRPAEDGRVGTCRQLGKSGC